MWLFAEDFVRYKRKISVSDSAKTALMTAVLCILGPLSLPIGPVPISFTNAAVSFAVILLGRKKGMAVCLLYLLIGFCGMPVFSGFGAGPAKLFGPTGGYLIGFLFLAAVGGWFIETFPKNKILHFAGLFFGMGGCYVFGTIWLAYQTKITLKAAFFAGVFPFLLWDILKIAGVCAAAPKLKKSLKQEGII